MALHAAEELLSFLRRRRPERFEVGARSAPELHVGVEAASTRVGVEVEERLVAEVEIRAVATSCHVEEPVDLAKGLDELAMAHPA